LGDGGEDVAPLLDVAGEADGGGVSGADADAFAVGADLRGGDTVDVPAGDLPLTDLDHAALAVQGQGGGCSGRRGGGGGDEPQGSAGEADGGHGGVLRRGVVGEGGLLGGDRFDGSGQPLQQVDVVDALVHQRPSPAGRVAAPGGRRIVVLVAPPVDVRGGQAHRAERAGLEGPAHRDHLGLEAALGGRGDGQPPLGGEADDPVGVGHGQDRESTRLNSSHVSISYAGIC